MYTYTHTHNYACVYTYTHTHNAWTIWTAFPRESEQLRSFFFPPICSVFVFPYHQAYSFMIDGYGIFTMHTHLGAWCTHEESSGTNKSAQGIDKLSLTLPRQEIKPRVFKFLNSDPLSTPKHYKCLTEVHRHTSFICLIVASKTNLHANTFLKCIFRPFILVPKILCSNLIWNHFIFT